MPEDREQPPAAEEWLEVEPHRPGILPGLITSRRPTGFLELDKPAPHECAPPHTGQPLATVPAGSVGAVWRCTCGRLWTVARLIQSGRGQMMAPPFDRRWVRAGWVTRWRYRNARASAAPPASAVGPPRRLPVGPSGISRRA